MGKRQNVPIIDYPYIRFRSQQAILSLLRSWLPDGKVKGQEYIALNPTRVDHHASSFRINIRSGRWADFATGDKGGDLIALLAYLQNIRQHEAAIRLSRMLVMEG